MYVALIKFRFLYFVALWILLVGASPGLKVQIQSNKLTVYANGAPLSEVLEAITEQAAITFKTIGQDQIPADPVSADFTDLSFDQGITRLLSKWDYALIKDPGTDRLKEVYIFATGAAPKSVEAEKDPTDDQTRLAIEQVKKAHNPEEQAKALLNLQHFDDDQTLEILRLALPSDNPKIRLAALESILLREVRDRVILEEINRISIYDPDPAVREKEIGRASCRERVSVPV
jgi:hypothetical protein